MSEIPSSRNIWRGEAKEYWITAVEFNGAFGSSYEIGIRGKYNEKFTLIQGPWYESQIAKVGEAVNVLLDAGFTPTEIQMEVFRS